MRIHDECFPLVLTSKSRPVGGMDAAVERIINGEFWPTDLTCLLQEYLRLKALADG